MSSNDKQSFDDAMCDVRTAYRLLHDYQRMVLDAVRFIANQLHLSYSGGWSKFSGATPRPGRGYLDNWSWDWLNFYCYEFVLEDKDQKTRLSILLVTDTGYFENTTDSRDQCATESFLPAGNSRSKLILFSTTDIAAWKIPNVRDPEVMKSLIAKDSPNAAKDGSIPTMFSRPYELSRIQDEESVHWMIDDFIKYAKTKASIFNVRRVNRRRNMDNDAVNWDAFLAAWPPSHVHAMTLGEFTDDKQDDASIDWLKFKLSGPRSTNASRKLKNKKADLIEDLHQAIHRSTAISQTSHATG